MVTERDYLGEAAQALSPIRQAFEDRVKRRTNLGILKPPTPLNPVGAPDPGDEHLSQHGMVEGSDDIELLSATFNKAVQKLIAASGNKIKVSSQKRDAKRQEELWAQALKKYGDPEIADNWVARPGGSYHEKGSHGLAADLKYLTPDAKKWVHENAAKYGLYFPLDNEDWHVELINGPRSKGAKKK